MGTAITTGVADKQQRTTKGGQGGYYISPPVCPPLLDKLSERGGQMSALASKMHGLSLRTFCPLWAFSFAGILSAINLLT